MPNPHVDTSEDYIITSHEDGHNKVNHVNGNKKADGEVKIKTTPFILTSPGLKSIRGQSKGQHYKVYK